MKKLPESCIALETRSYLTTLYSEPQRHYHNIIHVQDCLAKLEQLYLQTDEITNTFNALEIAIWFHDCIYNPKSLFNEENSVDLYKRCVRDRIFYNYQIVEKLILATKNHFSENLSSLEKIMIDIDLSILGASEKEYWRYSNGIKQEYYFVDSYNENRKKFLEKILSQKAIFKTYYFYEKYEKLARKNIENEIGELSS